MSKGHLTTGRVRSPVIDGLSIAWSQQEIPFEQYSTENFPRVNQRPSCHSEAYCVNQSDIQGTFHFACPLVSARGPLVSARGPPGLGRGSLMAARGPPLLLTGRPVTAREPPVSAVGYSVSGSWPLSRESQKRPLLG